jgi:uncharacterized small protein (DUF1192 family)
MQKTRVIMNGIVFGLSAMAIKDHEYETLLATDGDLMFESVTLAELEATYLYGKPLSPAPMYEAITTTKNRVTKTMAAFHRELSRQFSGTEIAPEVAEVGDPRVAGGFATLTARFPLNDGQSISIIFHSPSGDAAKITESDVLVAFRFLLNRRDVTLAVAPAGGVDVSLKQVTLKLANLAERNSSKFQSTQAKNNAKKSELATIQNEVETTEQELGEVIAQAETAEAGTLGLVDETKTYTLAVNKANERIKTLKAELARLQAKSAAKKPEQSGADNFVSDKIKDLAREMTLADFQRYAMANMSMNASDAEQLYKQAGDALKSEYDAKKAQETEALVTTDPLNVFLSSVNDSLKFRVNENELVAQSDINFYPDKKYPIVKVAVLSGKDIVSVRHHSNEGQSDVVDIIVDMTDAPEYKSFSGVLIADLEKTSFKNKTVNAVMAMVRKYTSALVDSSNLPAYGSRVDENLDLADIAKDTRALITAAKKSGKLPKGLKVSITKSGYSAINASIADVPEDMPLYSDKYLEHLRQIEAGEKDKYDYFKGHSQSADMTAIQAWVDAQIKAHHWDKSDSMTDYYNSAFHFMGTSPYSDDEAKAKELEAYKVRYKAEQAANKVKAYFKATKVEDEAYMFGLSELPPEYKVIHDRALSLGVKFPLHRGKVEIILPRPTANHAFSRYTANHDDLDALEWSLDELVEELDELEASQPAPSPAKDDGVWYGLRARPFSLGAQPSGQSEVIGHEAALLKWPALADSNYIRHGAIKYPAPLGAEQVAQYELIENLDDLSAVAELEKAGGFRIGDSVSSSLGYAIMDYETDGYPMTKAALLAYVSLPANELKKRIMEAVKLHSSEFKEKGDGETQQKSWKKFEHVMNLAIENPSLVGRILAQYVDDTEPMPEQPKPSAQTPKSTVIKLRDGFAGFGGVSLQYVANNGDSIVIADPSNKREPTFIVNKGDAMAEAFTFEGFNESNQSEAGLPEFILNALKSVDMEKHIDASGNMSFDGQDAIFDAFFGNSSISAYFGGASDMTKFIQGVRTDHNNGSKPFMQTYQGAAATATAPATSEAPSSKGVAEDTLREAMANATDVEALMDALDAFLAEVEADGTEDEYSELIDSASDRVTEMLEAF